MREDNPNYLYDTIAFFRKHKMALNALVIGVLALIGAIALAVYLIGLQPPKIVYPPLAACEALNADEAKELLGENARNSIDRPPVQVRHTALSQCGYTDRHPDPQQMRVIAISLRSGIDDAGVTENRKEFVTGSQSAEVEKVEGVGENAFYNARLGQLNVLQGKHWFILSIGLGDDPGSNTVEEAKLLAGKVLN